LGHIIPSSKLQMEMWVHFQYLCIKTFLMVYWGPIWVSFIICTFVLNIQDSMKLQFLKWKTHLGVLKSILLLLWKCAWISFPFFYLNLACESKARVATSRLWNIPLASFSNHLNYKTWSTKIGLTSSVLI
jgi:hypothetical protein